MPSTVLPRVAATLALAAAVHLASPDRALLAQDAADIPPRPSLPRNVDPNDWTAYFYRGVSLLERGNVADAEAAFIWASRIDPERPEPLLARWVAFWARQGGDRWMQFNGPGVHLDDVRGIREANALRRRALLRNPFAHEGMELLLYDRAGIDWRADPATQAWLAYAQGNYPLALRFLGRVRERDGARAGWVRFIRAQVLVETAQYDSALVEVAALRAQAEHRDTTRIVRHYVSKAPLDHAAAMLHLTGGRLDEARAAAERALVEDLSYVPAHAMLGHIALAGGDAAAALDHYRVARELDPADILLKHHYGTALFHAGYVAEAAEVLQELVREEPYYAAPKPLLGVALETLGEVDEARGVYAAYLDTVPAEAEAGRAAVSARLEALGAP
jgi:tetratricopeptide (TPR) repeat protein